MIPSWKHIALLLSLLGTAMVLFCATTEAARNVKGHYNFRALLSDTGGSSYDILCRGIDHPKTCFSVAKHYDAHNTAGLTYNTAQVVQFKAKEASKLASTLQGKQQKGSMPYQLLDVCRTNFNSMSEDIKAIVNILWGTSKAPIRNNLSALSTYLETCTDAYQESPGTTSPFDKTIGIMTDLVDNLFWFADKLKL